MATQALTGSLNVPFFSGIAVHPTKPAVMFARALTDDIFGTIDSGATWKLLCRGTNNGSSYGTIVVSPNGTAFSNGSYDTIDKVADVGGAACPKLARNVNYTGTSDTWFAFTSTGRIFNWNHDNGLSSSDDDGATWGRPGLDGLVLSLARGRPLRRDASHLGAQPQRGEPHRHRQRHGHGAQLELHRLLERAPLQPQVPRLHHHGRERVPLR